MIRRVFFSFLVLSFICVLPLSSVLAQQIPVMPALCYGELTINGEPAPVGTVVLARVDNIDRGSIEVDPEGLYGGPGIASKLTVEGSNLGGEMVEFYISGTFDGINFVDKFAGEELYWGSGNVKKIDLAIEVDQSDHQDDPVSDPPGEDDPIVDDPAEDPDPVDDNGEEIIVKLGDVNGDGDIDVKDVVLTMRAALDIIELNDRQKIAADVNKDNDINVKDVVLIMRYALDIIDSF